MSTVEPIRADPGALEAMAAKIDDLPLLPQVLTRILQLDPESDSYFEEFETLAREDPSFAVRVVALANSAASAPAVPIVTITDALARMGTACINALVASLAVQQVFVPTTSGQVLLWKHAITTAVGAQRIAMLLPQLGVDAGFAYLAGLLHDIGRFVMLEHAPTQLREVDDHQWTTPDDLVGADTAVFRFTHCQLGYLACLHWGLPDEIAELVQRHHKPPKHPLKPGSVDAANFCVQVADRLSVTIVDSTDCDEIDAAERATRIEEHCLKTEDDRALLPTDRLCAEIDPISAERKRLLDGLGLRDNLPT